jgi:hypothetical protein
MLSGFRLVGRYYIFYALTCNAASRIGSAAIVPDIRHRIRTQTVKSTQLTLKTCRKRSEMVDKNYRVVRLVDESERNRAGITKSHSGKPKKRVASCRGCESMTRSGVRLS